jgi:putative transposase
MPNYRRSHLTGGTFAFTVNLENRRSELLTRQIQSFRTCVKVLRQTRPFQIDAWVILPDHMHCLWTLPTDDTDYSGRWRDIKTRFSKSLPNVEAQTAEQTVRFGRNIWQKRFWEHTIRDERDYRNHMDYIHFNPIKHGYVTQPADWPFSTFKHCVALGLYDPSWASPDNLDQPDMGERT